MTIREALVDANGDGTPDRLGQRVTVVGVITAAPRLFRGGSKAAGNMQDETGGVRISAAGTWLVTAGVDCGDRVKVSGRVQYYKGADQIEAEQIEILGVTETPVPVRATAADLNGERYSEQLVRLTGNLVVPADLQQDKRGLKVTDATGSIHLNIPDRFFRDLEFGVRLNRGGPVEIVGIASQRDSTPPYTSDYRITPRSLADIRFAEQTDYRQSASAVALTLLTGLLFYLWARRRTAERHAGELREREARFRALFENHPHPLWVYDLQTLQVLEVNDAAAQQYGFSREEFLRMRITDFRPAEDVPRLMNSVAQPQPALQDSGRWRHVRKDGSSLVVHMVSHTLDYAGRWAALVVAQDVTEHAKAERELRLYYQIFSHSNEAIAILDPQGRVMQQNAAHRALLGYADEELVGQTPAAVLGDACFHQAMEALSSAGHYRAEVPCRNRSGQQLIVDLSLFTIRDDDGQVRCHVGLERDITSSKRLEDQLRQAQKIEAIGCLAGGVAHDFNNLLGVILGYSDVLLTRFSGQEQLVSKVAEIKKAGERAAALTRQLLAFSRKQVLEPMVLNLNSLVDEFQGMLKRLIGEDIQLAAILHPALRSMKADPNQIEQVLMNLAVNARDAMPHGGRLTLETSNVEIDEAFVKEHPFFRPGQYVMLAVSDTGSGMTPEVQAHIFEPFFTTKEVGKGTGLGLATVYGIVKQSGGYITVQSELKQGTTFRVYFPCVDGKPKVETCLTSDMPGGVETILVVEDAEQLRKLTCDTLSRLGYAVLEAESGQQAVEISVNHAGPIHVMLTDVVMPAVSGKELADHLAFHRPDMKVLYVSGYAREIITRHGVLQDGLAFLQKPFSASDLAFRIRGILDDQSSRIPNFNAA